MENNNISFEIVGIYPIYGVPPLRVSFSCHVYIPAWNLDMRGFMVHYAKDRPIRAFTPRLVGFDYEEGKFVTYPVVDTPNNDLINRIKEALKEYVLKEMEKIEFPKNMERSYKDYLLKSGKKLVLANEKNNAKFTEKKTVFKKKFTKTDFSKFVDMESLQKNK